MSNLEIYEISPEERTRLIAESGYGIDPLTNRGASAAREILAFLLGHPLPPIVDTSSFALADYMQPKVDIFIEEPSLMPRFGITQENLDLVQKQLS